MAPESMWAPASRDFSSTAMASGSPPWAFCSCASRSAADMPAGPPPTISTSTSSVSRVIGVLRGASGCFRVHQGASGCFLLLQFGDHRWHHLEQVAGDAEVGDLENGRLGVLV